MSNLAIIPARGGSKRIPRKNIRDFLGKPIIAYSIEAAIHSDLFQDVIVSTDDEEIASIARSYGAAVPFMRSAETSDDNTGIMAVVEEVVESLKQEDRTYEFSCCILATAPFVTAQKLADSYRCIKDAGTASLSTVSEFDYPIQRALRIEENRLSMLTPQNYLKRSQDLEKCFHDAGQFYWFLNSALKLTINNLFEGAYPFIIPASEMQDIDTETDWKIAEYKYNCMDPGAISNKSSQCNSEFESHARQP
ncbi:MAG: pseudaminic acid cytidylyltransferase [Cyanobacteria bacterium HKST-UBA01]|nr:pseudaminic acid cytidylyltransferase [Cyanobacteria bacterium HKST-UBA01]